MAGNQFHFLVVDNIYRSRNDPCGIQPTSQTVSASSSVAEVTDGRGTVKCPCVFLFTADVTKGLIKSISCNFLPVSFFRGKKIMAKLYRVLE